MKNIIDNKISPKLKVVSGNRYGFGQDTVWEKNINDEWVVTGSTAEISKVEMSIIEMSNWSFLQELIKKKNLLSKDPTIEAFPSAEREYIQKLINKHTADQFEFFSHIVTEELKSRLQRFHKLYDSGRISMLQQKLTKEDGIIKPYFTLKNGFKKDFLITIHSKILENRFTDSSFDVFMDFITKDAVNNKFNWTGSYQELWCFLQCMFTIAIENPYFNYSNIQGWDQYKDIIRKTRTDFSRWLNVILYNGINVNGGIFESDPFKYIKSKELNSQIIIRNKFFDLFNS